MTNPWRVGRRVAIHLYSGDEPVGTMLTPELAAEVVEAVNERAATRRSTCVSAMSN